MRMSCICNAYRRTRIRPLHLTNQYDARVQLLALSLLTSQQLYNLESPAIELDVGRGWRTQG